METKKISKWAKLIEDGAGKISSKRVAGLIGFGVFLCMSIVSGLHWYEIDTELCLGGLGICAGLLGVSTLTSKG